MISFLLRTVPLYFDFSSGRLYSVPKPAFLDEFLRIAGEVSISIGLPIKVGNPALSMCISFLFFFSWAANGAFSRSIIFFNSLVFTTAFVILR